MMSRVLVFGALLLLTACETTPPPVAINSTERSQALQQLDSFRVTGGLGVWTDEESISTRIEWQQKADDFDVLVRLPAGLSTVRIAQTDGQAVVQNGGAAPVSGSSAAKLLQQALGLNVAVPIEQMSLWIKGLPGEQAEAVRYDDQRRLASMEYVDDQKTRWRAKVLNYTSFKNTDVPALILATGGPYTVRLVLKRWGEVAIPADTKPENKPLDSQEAKSKGRLKVPGR